MNSVPSPKEQKANNNTIEQQSNITNQFPHDSQKKKKKCTAA